MRIKRELLRDRYGIESDRQRMTFKDLADLYEEYAREHKRSQEAEHAALSRLVDEFGSMPIAEIKPFRIEQLKRKMLAWTKRDGSAYQPSTIDRTHALVSRVLSIAVADGWLATHPMHGKVRRLREENMVEHFLTYEEERKLLAACLARADQDGLEDLT